MRTNYGCLSDGRETFLYQLSNHNGMQVSVLDYGATLVSMVVPDKNHKPVDVVLGYADAAGYEEHSCMFGATVGPNCNRIRGAVAQIDGKNYQLEINDGKNNLHTGKNGFHNMLFLVTGESEKALILKGKCSQKETGLPGELDVEVKYELGEDNTLEITYRVTSSEKTLVNVTNHTYFNLNGHDNPNAMNQHLLINAQKYTTIDNEGIPDGRIFPVEGTPFDFRKFSVIKDKMSDNEQQLVYAGGFDHNFLFTEDGQPMSMSKVVAKAYASESGICMDLATNAGAMQFYSANYVGNQKGKNGVTYQNRNAFCLEPQHVPDAIHLDQFMAPLVEPGEVSERKISYHFSIKDC